MLDYTNLRKSELKLSRVVLCGGHILISMNERYKLWGGTWPSPWWYAGHYSIDSNAIALYRQIRRTNTTLNLWGSDHQFFEPSSVEWFTIEGALKCT